MSDEYVEGSVEWPSKDEFEISDFKSVTGFCVCYPAVFHEPAGLTHHSQAVKPLV